MDSRVREIVKIGDGLFGARLSLMTYLQELADHFYPERADFTVTNSLGNDRTWQMSSEPVLIRRELGNIIQSMLRPESQDWFGIHLSDEEADEDNEVRRWLEWMTKVQRRAMYAPSAHFAEATKEADHDWVTFGMAVVEIDVRQDFPSLIFRCGHIRDHAWSENQYGEIDTVYREWKPTARQLKDMFPKTIHSRVQDAAEKEPNTRINCCRIVLPRDAYGGAEYKRTPRAPFVSLYIDKDNDTVLEETPLLWNPFVIPRWQTVSGSQYGWSPCTGPGLADARTLQAVVRVLLEAGEKAVDPPLIATQDTIRSDINIYAGGITWIDNEYDERLGDALRPMSQDRSGIPVGLEMADRLNRVLKEGFFLDKMRLPQTDGEQPTAYHVRKMLEEHIRSASPILTPAEDEYSNRLCERSFEILSAVKAFGSTDEFPEGLRGKDIRYQFRSPIRDMSDELKSQTLVETVEIIGAVSQVDPTQKEQIDWTEATRDALKGRRVPAKWMRDPKAFAKKQAEMQRAQQIAQGAAAVQQGADAVGSAAQAGAALEAVGMA